SGVVEELRRRCEAQAVETPHEGFVAVQVAGVDLDDRLDRGRDDKVRARNDVIAGDVRGERRCSLSVPIMRPPDSNSLECHGPSCKVIRIVARTARAPVAGHEAVVDDHVLLLLWGFVLGIYGAWCNHDAEAW